jgi:hypothetical protein
MCCPFMCLYVLSVVLRCPLRFPHKNNVRFYTSSCLQEGWCLIYVICVDVHTVLYHTYRVVFFVVFLCPFLIAPSVFKQWWYQINQYQTKRTITSHLNWTQWKEKERPKHVTLEIQILVCDRHTNVAELYRLMGPQHSTLDNWISNSNTYINKR